MSTWTLNISGMSCGKCVGRVERALRALEATDVAVELDSATARVSFDGDGPGEDVLRATLDDAGYPVTGATAG